MSDMLVDETVREFLRRLGSPEPVPGGGSASALAGATAANLFAMVINLTIQKEPEKAEALRTAQRQVMALAEACTRMVDKDSSAYEKVRDAYRLPKESEEEKLQRKMAIQLATREASAVPLELAERVIELMEVSSDVARLGRASAITDAGVGNFLGLAAIMGALLNVEVNLQGLTDEDFVKETAVRVAAVQAKSRELFDRNQQIVLDRMDAGS